MNNLMLKLFGVKLSSKEEKVGEKRKQPPRRTALQEKGNSDAIVSNSTECKSCLECHSKLFVLPCQHAFCSGCVRGLFQTALKDKELIPVKCCGKRVDQRLRRDVLSFEELDAFEKLLEEADTLQKLYCPGKGCSVFYNLDRVQTNTDGAFNCSECKTLICAQCRTSHPQYTCAQYNALPLHERAPEDLEFFEVAKLKRYSRCTRCSRFTELVALNCGTVHCKCGHSYGYAQHRYTGPANVTAGGGLSGILGSAAPFVPIATADGSDPYALEEAPCVHEWRGCNRVLDRPRLCHLCRQTKRCFQSSCTKCRLRVCAICMGKLSV